MLYLIVCVVFCACGLEKLSDTKNTVESQRNHAEQLSFQDAVKKDDILVLENYEIAKGEKVWNDFLGKVLSGSKATLIIYHYGQEENKYRLAEIMTITYDGNNYLVERNFNGEIMNEQYSYLKKLKGRSPNAVRTEEGYFLVNDDELTYMQIDHSKYSNDLKDKIDYIKLFSKFE